jgi:hypothetical protein
MSDHKPADGSTPEEAFRQLREDVALSDHPWLRWAGTLKDDPMVDDWRRAVAEYRARIENDPEIP